MTTPGVGRDIPPGGGSSGGDWPGVYPSTSNEPGLPCVLIQNPRRVGAYLPEDRGYGTRAGTRPPEGCGNSLPGKHAEKLDSGELANST